MSELRDATLCVLGCGNLGGAILSSLISPSSDYSLGLPFTRFIACVRSAKSQQSLEERFSEHRGKWTVRRDDNVKAAEESDVILLAADPADVETVLKQTGLCEVLKQKLLISVVAGWTRQKIETTMYGEPTESHTQHERAWVLRTLPNIAALVSQSLTAIEISEPAIPDEHLEVAEAIFQRIGRTVRIPPRLMNATTAVGGSTPAFFAVICDALVDASVAVGVPRDMAQTMIFQSMQGTAALLQSGIHTGVLKDQGTSPEGCTMGGLMVLEESAVRGHVGRALREAVTVARLMGTVEHVNDTRH